MNLCALSPRNVPWNTPVFTGPGGFQKLAISLLFASVLFIAGAATAQEGPTPEYSINWYTFDGGGGNSSGGAFSLTGTIGQHDASTEEATGGTFSLTGGFWNSGRSDHLFSDGYEELSP